MAGLAGLWEFDDAANLTKATVGSDLILNGTGQSAVAGIDGSGGAVAVEKGTFYQCAHGISANGGGNWVNEFTLLFDVMYPEQSAGKWRAFYQTGYDTYNDSEYFIQPADESWGVGDLGYTDNATVGEWYSSHSTWYRVVLTVNLDANPDVAFHDLYINGELKGKHNTDSLVLDGRFSLYASDADNPYVVFAGDNDGDDALMHFSNIAIWDRPLTPQEIARLGGPGEATVLDRDGDGLRDVWETNGIDINGDGIIGLNLPGADPNHKDLFVEIDAMVGRAPNDVNLTSVVDAFADAPNALVKNPDRRDGIKLHIEFDELNIPLPAPRDANVWDADPWAAFDAVKADRFGTVEQRASENWINIKTAKALVYRYCIFADTHSGGTSSGFAEVPGNDFMVTLGAWTLVGGTDLQQEATFMHELGHTLGLRHGGDQYDSRPGMDYRYNYKPNYHSIMNYTWQMPDPCNAAFEASWVLDYSREQLPTLSESDLSEPNGIGGHVGHVVSVGPIPERLVNENGPVDWNHDGDANDLGVTADINWIRAADPASPNDVLTGYNDWINLKYRLWGHDNFAVGVHTETTIDIEMTFEIFQELRRIGCLLEDLNCDGRVNFRDLAILGGQWHGSSADPSADIAPEGGNMEVDFLDLAALVDNWLGP